jgi:serine/threonine-protein kinase HipA
LQAAAHNLQDDQTAAVKKWLAILMAPGSSLGGARPKANISDKDDGLWIAKFPSKNDAIDKGAWEYLAYVLATKAGIEMAPCKLEKVSGKYHTFFTKRFDRETGERLHFSSAMTMTRNNEEILKTKSASYLDIVDFIITFGVNVEQNLHQLWRRIVFNICISNTDDHLRNHGFILTPKGWILSPAYDLNPSVNKEGLALNIDVDNNALEIDLAKNVGEYFRLSSTDMDEILTQVKESVRNWRGIADKIGIPRAEQKVMQTAFRV